MSSNRTEVYPLLTEESVPRVVHIVRSLEVGGLEKVVCELVSCRGTADTDVICLTAEGEFADLLRDQGGRVYVLGDHSNARQLVQPLRRLLRKIQPDVVHCHNLFAHATGCMAAFLSGRMPTVLTKHGTFLPRGRTGGTLHRALLRKSDVVAVSSEIQQIMVRWAPFLRDRIRTIPNGVAIPNKTNSGERNTVRESLGCSEANWIFISVSRLVAGKRVDDLIRAFGQVWPNFPNARLLVVGDGPELASLKQLVTAESLKDGVQFLGARMDVPSLLAAADTFVLASENEGLPMSLLEAMSCGLPSVVTKVGEIPFVIEEGCNGYLVSPLSVLELADAMSRILSDRLTAREFGHNAHSRVEEFFGIRSTVAKYEAVYRQALTKALPEAAG